MENKSIDLGSHSFECPNCQTVIDQADPVNHSCAEPEEGHLIICHVCAKVLEFRGSFYPISEKKLERIKKIDPFIYECIMEIRNQILQECRADANTFSLN